MRRSLGVRVLMFLTGVVMLVVYAMAAFGAYRILLFLWQRRPDPVTTVVVVLAVTLTLGYASYQFSTTRLLRALRADPVPRREAPELYRRLDELAAEVGTETPDVLVAHMDAPNALALGGPSDGYVVLDASLFRLLSARELEAILAHELAHLDNRDGLIQTLGASLVQTVAGLLFLALLPLLLLVGGIARAIGYMSGASLSSIRETAEIARTTVGLLAILLLFALTLGLRAYSRHRELAADDVAADVADPRAMASALRKIQRAATPSGPFSSLYIHGDEEGPLTRLLATHPPMEKRVERLHERSEKNSTRIPIR